MMSERGQDSRAIKKRERSARFEAASASDRIYKLPSLSVDGPSLSSVYRKCMYEERLEVEFARMEFLLRAVEGCERKIIIVASEDGAWAYDVDIGEEVICSTVTTVDGNWHSHSKFLFKKDFPVLMLRMYYFLQVFGRRGGGYVAAFPSRIRVGGVLYRLHHTARPSNTTTPQPITDRDNRIIIGIPCSEPPRHATHLTAEETNAVPAQPVLLSQTINGRTVWRTSDGSIAFAEPVGYALQRRGKQLWEQFYGEVYRCALLERVRSELSRAAAAAPTATSTTDTQTEAIYRPVSGWETAMKVVRHANTWLPGAEGHWTNASGQAVAQISLAEYDAGLVALTTAEVGPHFITSKEDPIGEIKYSHMLVQAIAQSENPDLYRTRFVPLSRVGISCHNVFVGTRYAALGSLVQFAGETRRMPLPMVKRVLKHVLQAVDFMHERGMAHQDISAANVILLNPRGVDRALFATLVSPVALAAFYQLEAALIDFGQAALLEPAEATPHGTDTEPATRTTTTAPTCDDSEEDQEGDEGREEVEVRCAEVTTARLEAAGMCPGKHTLEGKMGTVASSSDHSIATTTEMWSPVTPGSSSKHATSPLPTPRGLVQVPIVSAFSTDAAEATRSKRAAAEREFKLQPFPLSPWGKPSYRPPELSAGSTPAPYCPRAADMWQVGVLMIYMVVSHYHQGYLAQLGTAAMAENLKALHDACKESKLRELQYNYPVAVTLPGESQPTIVNATFPLFSFLNESAPAMAFLEALLKYDPAQRLTAKQALAHPWLSDVAD